MFLLKINPSPDWSKIWAGLGFLNKKNWSPGKGEDPWLDMCPADYEAEDVCCNESLGLICQGRI